MTRVISILLIAFVLFALCGCDELPVVVPEGSTPPASADVSASGNADATGADETLPADTLTTPPSDTAGPDSTGSAPPDGTASAAPTDSPAATATPAPTATPSGGSLAVDPVIGKVKPTEGLALRAKASDTAEILAQIPADGEFTVLQVESGKQWLIVQYKDTKGFVPAKSVSVGSGDDLVCTVFCNSVLNVRSAAGTTKKVIGTVGSGTSFIVKAKTTVSGKTWYEVVVGSSTGYIVAQYCRISAK